MLVSAGTFEETVVVSTPDVTLRGTDRNRTVIDGGGTRPYGVVGIADGVRVQNLTVRNHLFYGVLVTGLHDEKGPRANNGDSYEPFDPEEFPPVDRFAVEYVTAYDNGLYGIYAFDAQHGVIANSYASGSADSGFYVGQCRDCDILVDGNVAERNAVGFENANASEPVVVTGNRFAGNRVGLTLLSNYQEAFGPQEGNVVVGNVISDNNEADSPAQADGGFGVGVGIAGGRDNKVVRNRIDGHRAGRPRAVQHRGPPRCRQPLRGQRLRGEPRGRRQRVGRSGRCDGDLSAGGGHHPSSGAGPQLRGCGDGPLAAVPGSVLLALRPAPPGVSFLQVAPPRDQPGMPGSTSELPEPLPDRVEMPDVDAVALPPADLLGDRAGTR